MKQKNLWLKLIGGAFLLHIVLIIISVLEVTIYSYLITPDKGEAFYQAHAQISGPWISGIFGSLFIFLIVRRFIKRNSGHYLTYTIVFPFTYSIMDILILLAFHINWNEHLPVFLMANGAKIASSFFSYYIYKPTIKNEQRPY
ncbi:MAG TPA: hypothetical protein VM888_09835 [Chitinophagaceae bacterium]|jgi:uncharacterized membrane protein YobD (UPF0266 family)|nr:hypothetical protein [Chitinophagaceae bacterium]